MGASMVEQDDAAPPSAPAPAPWGLRDLWILLGLLLAGNALLGWSAPRTFDFFDMSAFMDAGYRVYSGQAIYQDFAFNAGPVHPYLYALFFSVFGVSKLGLLAYMWTVNGVVVAATYALARLHLERLAASALGALTALSFNGPLSHPWYDSTAHMWLVLAFVALERSERGPRSVRVEVLLPAVCGGLACLALFTKANIGGAGGVALFAYLLLCWRSPRRALLSYSLGAALVAALVLIPLRAPLHLLLEQNFLSYRSGSRLGNLLRLQMVLQYSPYALVLAATGVLGSLGGLAFVRAERRLFVVLLLLSWVAVFSVWTGSLAVMANTALVGPELCYVLILATRLPGRGDAAQARIARSGRRVAWGLLLYSVVVAATHLSLLTAWTWRGGWRSDHTLTSARLRGWRCDARVGTGVDAVVEYIRTRVPPQDRLLVFPDATVIYALSGRESYPRAPFIFHLMEFPMGRAQALFNREFAVAPPEWFVLHRQIEVEHIHYHKLLTWLRLTKPLQEDYELVWSKYRFAIFRRKASAPPVYGIPGRGW